MNSPKIDVHGMTAREAIDQVKIYLPQFKSRGYHEVYIIHGKGQGILRANIRAALRSNPYIRTFRPGNDHEGGNGVTVVEF